ncbi:UDP-N-acetylmuramate dehydrogenase [Candidatus Woesebacteria bacterium]|nr:UDP-N-acetylmuramate dehydrogenase [Candidatus Woesebacteria bacterium]
MENVLKAQFGDRIKQNVDLSPYFTLKIHTRAEYYLEATSIEDWQDIMKVTSVHAIPLFILGGGSNIACLKQTILGLVIRNRYIKKEVISETDEYIDMMFSSGYPMSHIVKETTNAGLSGFQHHLGLPGTLGGAIYMNSKWTKPVSYVGDNLVSGTIINHMGEVRTEPKEYFQFGYDYSKLQDTKEVILEGIFRLKKESPELLKQQSQEALAYRKETQPFGVATGGCFFQNISEEEKELHNLPTTSAGFLIDQAGLKGKKMGAFVVSEKHANFVINTGDGQPEDLKELLAYIKSQVMKKFGVALKEEVEVRD